MAHDPAITLGSPTEFGETYFLSCDDCGGTPLAGPTEDLDEIEALLEIHRRATAGLDRAPGQEVGSVRYMDIAEEEFAVIYEALRRANTPYTHEEAAGVVAAEQKA